MTVVFLVSMHADHALVEPNPREMVVSCMMTNIQTVAKKIIQPVALAVAMLFLTPVAGLLQAALKAPYPVQVTTQRNGSLQDRAILSCI